MKGTTLAKSILTTGVISASIALTSCFPDPYYQAPRGHRVPNNNGQKFKADLAQAIMNSNKIVILQHSNPIDFQNLNLTSTPHYGYGSRILSPSAKAQFLTRVRNLNGYNRIPRSRSKFTPHHTIKFYNQGKLKSTMKVCFSCVDLSWNGSPMAASGDIFRAVGPTIESAGFNIRRDWTGLAKVEHSSRPVVKPKVNPKAQPKLKPKLKPKPKPFIAKTAKKVPGKPGHVFNPYTGNIVNVSGIASGTKVRDPQDSNPKHIFRVP